MKKVILSLAAVAAAAAALPAAAQGYGRHYEAPAYGAPAHGAQGWTPVEVRLERLHERIQRGMQSGQLTRREAQGLRAEFRDLVHRERAYGRDGLSWRERADLDARLDRLAAQVRFERRDGEERGGGYARRDGYGRGDGSHNRPHRGY